MLRKSAASIPVPNRGRLRILFAVAIVALAGLASVSCGDDGGGCEKTADCGEGQTCVSGECMTLGTGCSGDVDCPAGMTCIEASCVARVFCTKDADCAAGQVCEDANCKDDTTEPECTVDDDCPGGHCNTTAGKCVLDEGPCAVDADCDDGDPCSLDVCQDSSCAHAADTAAGCCTADADCVDANPCTVDACVAERCEHDISGAGSCCASDADCDDGDGCTSDRCIASACYHPHQSDSAACPCTSTSDCDDGNPCTIDSCLSSECSYMKNPNSPSVECCLLDSACDDGEPLTVDSCSDLFICDHVLRAPCQADTSCNDQNPCTVDQCVEGFCQSGDAGIEDCCVTAGNCDDGNEASVDTCVENRCEHVECQTDSECDDEDPETVDLCEENICVHIIGCEEDSQCADEDPCTEDLCTEAHDCEHPIIEGCCNLVTDCDDDDVGTIDTCEEHACVHEQRPTCETEEDCEDGFGCTDDACVLGYCERAPNIDDPACACAIDGDCKPVEVDKSVVCALHIGSLPDPLHNVCQEVIGPNLGGQSCAWDSQCQSNFCLSFEEGQICYGACANDDDCFTGSRCGEIGFSGPAGEPFSIGGCIFEPTVCINDAACLEGQICAPGESLITPHTTVGYCVSASDTGTAAIGATCASDADCLANACYDLGPVDAPDLRCIGVCDTDADCHDSTRCYDNRFYLIYDNDTPDNTVDDVYGAWPICAPNIGSNAACTKDSACPSGEFCDLAKNSNQTAFDPRCRTIQGGTVDPGGDCWTDDDCKSSACVGNDNGAGFCFGVCEDDYDCDISWASCEVLDLIVDDRGTEDEADDLKAPIGVCVQ